jgi:hypothetical protein
MKRTLTMNAQVQLAWKIHARHQTVFVRILTLLAGAYLSAGRLPWWYDLHAVCLLAVEAAFVLLFGGMGLLLGLPFFWGDL